jgi:hypothetical protein
VLFGPKLKPPPPPPPPPPAPPPPADAAEGEDVLTLEEEIAPLREEQAETRQVDLRLVVFHLREIGVVGEVGDQRLRDAPLGVDAPLEVAVVLLRRIEREVRDR